MGNSTKRILAVFTCLFVALVAFPQSSTAETPDSLTADTLSVCRESTPKKKKKGVFRAIGSVFTKIFRGFNDIDTSYIEPQHYNYAAMLQTTYTYESYTIKSQSGQSFSFAPKPSVKVGPYMGWRWLFLGYTLDINHLESSDRKREFDLSLYSSMLGIDLYYRRTGDDYRISKAQLGDNAHAKLLDGVPFSGLSVGITGFNLYYIFNHRHFSYPAAFSQSTRQKRSCGSVLAGIGYTYHSLSLDFDALKNTVDEYKVAHQQQFADFTLNEDFNFKSVKYQSYSASVGYAYNWVFLRNCLFSASLSTAVAYKNTRAAVKAGSSSFEDFNFKNFNFDGIGRFGLVWNNDRLYAGASTILHTYNYKKSRFSTNSYFGSLNIYFGLNFGVKKAYRKKRT